MSKVSVYTFDDVQLLEQANYTMGRVVDGLRLEGFLTQEQANDIHTNYSVMVESKEWLPSFLSTWLGMRDSAIKMRLVKAIGREKSA